MELTRMTCASWKALVYLVSSTDQQSLIKIKCMIPEGRRLYALGHVVYLCSSLVSTAEGFQREELCENAKGHGRTLSSYAAQLYDLLLQRGMISVTCWQWGDISLLPGTLHQEFPVFMDQQAAVDPRISLLFSS